MLFEAEVCCARKKYLGAKQQKHRHAIRFTFHHENTNVIPKRMCVDFRRSSQSSSMSGRASATPSLGSTEQQTSWSARPCSRVGSSLPRNKKVILFEAEACCAMKKYLGAKQQKRRHATRFTFHHENTNVIPKPMCL